jgi:hypothetical protein
MMPGDLLPHLKMLGMDIKVQIYTLLWTCWGLNDDGHLFETVDGNECLIRVVFQVQEHSLDYFFWFREKKMPPKL